MSNIRITLRVLKYVCFFFCLFVVSSFPLLLFVFMCIASTIPCCLCCFRVKLDILELHLLIWLSIPLEFVQHHWDELAHDVVLAVSLLLIIKSENIPNAPPNHLNQNNQSFIPETLGHIILEEPSDHPHASSSRVEEGCRHIHVDIEESWAPQPKLMSPLMRLWTVLLPRWPAWQHRPILAQIPVHFIYCFNQFQTLHGH